MGFAILIFLAACFVAYSNGANDNFKGVATLFGSGTTNYRRAIGWATVTTLAGSICSILLAASLVKSFSGKGLVPDRLVGAPEFTVAVALGAGMTVMLATLTGFPVSTTHGLTGALLGSGLMAVGTQVNIAVLGSAFFVPLLVSPVIAVMLGLTFYWVFHRVRFRVGRPEELCVCMGEAQVAAPVLQGIGTAALSITAPTHVSVSLAHTEICERRYGKNVLVVNLRKALDGAHYISAGLVSFARGLNDTPKIVALLLAIKALSIPAGMGLVACGMTVGGLLNARKVAETMSHKITPLNAGQGFTANFVTALLVVFASRLGLPVSTTHVSVGAISGIGLITGKANKRVVSEIALSWLLTLPIAAVLGGMTYWILTHVR
jgi:PiT family inorganic phosphate transporter